MSNFKEIEYNNNNEQLSRCSREVIALIEELKNYLQLYKGVLKQIDLVIPDDAGELEAKAFYSTFKNSITDVQGLAATFNQFLKKQVYATIAEKMEEGLDIRNLINNSPNESAEVSSELALTIADSVLNEELAAMTEVLPVKRPLKLDLPAFVKTVKMKNFEKGYQFKAYITYIESSDQWPHFYLSKLSLGKILPIRCNEKLKELKYYNLPVNSIFALKNPNLCNLQRAVLSKELNSNEILLIDTGERVETDQYTKYYQLPKTFGTIPAQAIFCRLVKAQINGCNKIHHFVEIINSFEHQLVTFKVIDNDDVKLDVEVILEIETEIKHITPYLVSGDIRRRLFNNIQLNSVIVIKPTKIQSACLFYGYMPEYMRSKRSHLSWTDEEIQITQRLYKSPHIGDIVLAVHVDDRRYYRAMIIGFDIEDWLYEVFFMDYGYCCVLPLSCLAKCHVGEDDEPFCVLRCRITGPNKFVNDLGENNFQSIELMRKEILFKKIELRMIGRTSSALLLQFVSKKFHN